jgi:hypothetical protein
VPKKRNRKSTTNPSQAAKMMQKSALGGQRRDRQPTLFRAKIEREIFKFPLK